MKDETFLLNDLNIDWFDVCQENGVLFVRAGLNPARLKATLWMLMSIKNQELILCL